MKTMTRNHSVAFYLTTTHGLKFFPCHEKETTYTDKTKGKTTVLSVKAPDVAGGFKSAADDPKKSTSNGLSVQMR